MKPPTNRQAWSPAVVLVLLVAVLAACSSGKSASKGQFEISTADGQLSLSLDGHLPPNWPTDIPLPSDAKPAGSGSVVGGSSGVKVGVYTSQQTPQEVYLFYTEEKSLQIASKSAIGSGSSFVGRVKVNSPSKLTVTVVPHEGKTAIVVVIPGGTG